MYNGNRLLSNNLLASEPEIAPKVVVWAKEAREAPAAAVPLPVRSVVPELPHLRPLFHKSPSQFRHFVRLKRWCLLQGRGGARRARRVVAADGAEPALRCAEQVPCILMASFNSYSVSDETHTLQN